MILYDIFFFYKIYQKSYLVSIALIHSPGGYKMYYLYVTFLTQYYCISLKIMINYINI